MILEINGDKKREYLAILSFAKAKNGQSEYFPENSDKSYKINELLGIVEVKSETEVMQMLHKIVIMLQAQGFQEEKDLFDHIDEVVKVNPSFCRGNPLWLPIY